MNTAFEDNTLRSGLSLVEETSERTWQDYVEDGQRVFLFVSTEEEYRLLRDKADTFYPRADIVIIVSKENIVSGRMFDKRVMIRVS